MDIDAIVERAERYTGRANRVAINRAFRAPRSSTATPTPAALHTAKGATRDLDLHYRWDLLWAVHGQLPDVLRKELDDLRDTHIDTALRRIVAHL